MTWDLGSKTVTVYIDGNITGVYSNAPETDFSAQTGLILILAQYSTGYSQKLNTLNLGYHVKAALDEIRVYNRILSAEEMRELSKADNPDAFGSSAATQGDDSLLLHYTFDDAETPFRQTATANFLSQIMVAGA